MRNFCFTLSVLLFLSISLAAQPTGVRAVRTFGQGFWQIEYNHEDGRTTVNNGLGIHPIAEFIEFDVPLDEERDGIRDGKEQRFWYYEHRPLGQFRIPLMKVDSLNITCDNDRPYETVFFDDFNFIDTTVWTPGASNRGTFRDTAGLPFSAAWALPENVYAQNGILNLSLQRLDTSITRTWEQDGDTLTQTRHYSTGSLVSNNRGGGPSGGCWREGRYTWRAKISEEPSIPAIWMFGWAGEMDMFEVRPQASNPFQELTHSIHSWALVDGCSMYKSQDELIRTIPAQYECSADEVEDEHLILNDNSAITSDMRGRFVNYVFEWTPYKLRWYVDGELVHEMFRYYKVLFAEGGVQSVISMRGLDCNQIQSNTMLPNVWENLMWNRLSYFGMDMLIQQDIDPEQSISDSLNFKLDWFKVEQKTGGAKLRTANDNDTICALGTSRTYTFDVGTMYDVSTAMWNISDNFAIIAETETSITVQAIGFGEAFVELIIDNPMSCHHATFRKEVVISEPPQTPIAITRTEDPINCCYKFKAVTHNSLADKYIWTVNGESYVSYQKELQICFDDRYALVSVQEVNGCGESGTIYDFFVREPINSPYCMGKKLKITTTPNPTTGVFGIDVKGLIPGTVDSYEDLAILVATDPNYISLESSYQVSVVDQTYNVITTKTITPTNFNQNFDLTGQMPGEYFITTVIDNEPLVAKIIKQ